MKDPPTTYVSERKKLQSKYYHKAGNLTHQMKQKDNYFKYLIKYTNVKKAFSPPLYDFKMHESIRVLITG